MRRALNAGSSAPADRVAVAAPAARTWLGGADAIRLLNRFQEVINLVDTSGGVVSLVRNEALLGPFAAVVPSLRPAEWPDDRLDRSVLPGIDSAVSEWNPKPDWDCVRATRCVDVALATPSGQASLAALDRLATALVRGGSADAVSVALELAGAGAGLTPEGDDVLVGAMHAIWASRPDASAVRLCSPLAEAAAPRTTVLSAAWLRAAARGEAAAPWHVLVSALAASRGEPSPGVEAARQGILAMGETSGAAALSGFAATLARFRG